MRSMDDAIFNDLECTWSWLLTQRIALWEFVCDLSNGAITNDPQSRPPNLEFKVMILFTTTSNSSKMVKDIHSYNGRPIVICDISIGAVLIDLERL